MNNFRAISYKSRHMLFLPLSFGRRIYRRRSTIKPIVNSESVLGTYVAHSRRDRSYCGEKLAVRNSPKFSLARSDLDQTNLISVESLVCLTKNAPGENYFWCQAIPSVASEMHLWRCILKRELSENRWVSTTTPEQNETIR
jgi:hypothetical protein